MALTLQPMIEYLLAQRWQDGKLVTSQQLQWQVPFVPAATATVQSLSSINTGPRASDFADIAWHLSADPRLNPDVFDITVLQFGAEVSTSFVAMDLITEGISTFLVITQEQQLRWEIENLSLMPQFLLATMHFLAVPSLPHLQEVYRRLERYGGSDAADAMARVEAALQQRFVVPPRGES